MPVTFTVATHGPKYIQTHEHSHKTVEDFFKASCYKQWKASGEMLQTSLMEADLPTLSPKTNGFVHTVIEAYGQHHHLTLRPDDVWIAILSQLSFYVNKHAEELRKYFVAHEGKKELHVDMVGSRYTVDFGHVAIQMSDQIHENVVDKTLVEWVLPDFSTSTSQDVTICSVLLMSNTQKSLDRYFEFMCYITCGIPSVTLEGEKADWEKLYRRLDRLPELGSEPEQWAVMLRPILRRFVDAFDGSPDIAFWEHVVHRDNELCGSDRISGWITAFCVWDVDGHWLAPSQTVGAGETTGSGVASSHSRSYSHPDYTLDGAHYFSLERTDIPAGYSEVDVLVNDNGQKFDCKMVSGHIASGISKSVEDGAFDTLRPAPQWFLYVKADKPRRGYEEETMEMFEGLMRKSTSL